MSRHKNIVTRKLHSLLTNGKYLLVSTAIAGGFLAPALLSNQAYASTSIPQTTTVAQASAGCDTSGSPLSWIICPIIEGSAGFVDFAFNSIIRPMLEQVPITTNTKSGIYIAWSQFRILANVLLVASLLVVVYSQARGGK